MAMALPRSSPSGHPWIAPLWASGRGNGRAGAGANPNSLLAHLFGLWRVSHGGRRRYFLVQENVAPPALAGPTPVLYDLKGRVCKAGKWRQNVGRADYVRKDKDLDHHFVLEAPQLEALRCQLRADTARRCPSRREFR